MATISRGMCVGVLYRATHGAECKDGHCVHNGRFIGAVIGRSGNTLRLARSISDANLHAYHGVLLSHWAINKSTVHAHIQHLYFSKERLQAVSVTPYARYAVCPKHTDYSVHNVIHPGECVGIKYRIGNEWYIRNGRYLYWRGQRNHCNLDQQPQSTNLKSLKEIAYAHWVLDHHSHNVTAQKKSRGPDTPGKEHINYVFKTTIPSDGHEIDIQDPVTFSSTKMRIDYV